MNVSEIKREPAPKETKYVKTGFQPSCLCPVWGKRKAVDGKHVQLIRSFRVWIHWQDGDWTAETLKSFHAGSELRGQVEKMIREGAACHPWPKGDGIHAKMQKKALQKKKMFEWSDGNVWQLEEQTDKNEEDGKADLPAARCDGFKVFASDSEDSDELETLDYTQYLL